MKRNPKYVRSRQSKIMDVVVILFTLIFFVPWLVNLLGLVDYEIPLSQQREQIVRVELLDSENYPYTVMKTLTGEEMDHMAQVASQPESTAHAERSIQDYISLIRGEGLRRGDLQGDDLLLAAQRRYQQKKAYMEDKE